MRLSTNPAIERLRNMERNQVTKPTVPQLHAIVTGLQFVKPLAEVAEDSHMEPEAVISLVAQLGTWLTHVHGGSGAVPTYDADQQVLFQAAAGLGATGAKCAKKPEPKTAKRSRKPDTLRVLVPQGFPKRVGKALVAVVSSNPIDATLARFIEREYPTRNSVLTFTVLSSVAWWARTGRLGTIDQVNSDNEAFCELLVQAYDLLALAITQASEGIKVLATADLANMTRSTLDQIELACAKALWLDEMPIGRIEAAVGAARSSERGAVILARELMSFRQALRTQYKRYDIGVEGLNSGQVRRIAQAAGIKVEATTRAEEAKIRDRLRSDFGFASDLDRLVPMALRSIEAGHEEEFWAAMDRRKDGARDWQDRLRYVLAANAAVATANLDLSAAGEPGPIERPARKRGARQGALSAQR